MTFEPHNQHIEAFRRLLQHLPGTNDNKHMLLKGHLLIEEQLKIVCSERVRRPKALNFSDPKWTAFQVISLAEALCGDDADEKLWNGLRKLNKLRNEVAHNLEPKGLSDKIADFIQSWPSGIANGSTDPDLFITLSSMFVMVTKLNRDPLKKVVDMVPPTNAL